MHFSDPQIQHSEVNQIWCHMSHLRSQVFSTLENAMKTSNVNQPTIIYFSRPLKSQLFSQEPTGLSDLARHHCSFFFVNTIFKKLWGILLLYSMSSSLLPYGSAFASKELLIMQGPGFKYSIVIIKFSYL